MVSVDVGNDVVSDKDVVDPLVDVGSSLDVESCVVTGSGPAVMLK
jgi:hypothetical protein